MQKVELRLIHTKTSLSHPILVIGMLPYGPAEWVLISKTQGQFTFKKLAHKYTSDPVLLLKGILQYPPF